MSNLKKKCILIVEDDPYSMLLLKSTCHVFCSWQRKTNQMSHSFVGWEHPARAKFVASWSL